MQHSPNRSVDVVVDAAHLSKTFSGQLVWKFVTSAGVFLSTPGAQLDQSDAWTHLRTLTLGLDDAGHVISASPAARVFLTGGNGCTVEAAVAATRNVPNTRGGAR